jgi:hypothetical protein
MAPKRVGRPKGSKNAVDVVVVERSHCPKCGSSRRSEYWGRMVQRCPGLRTDATLRSSDASSLRSTSGTPYSSIIRRRCRCLDCGQVRIDKEYA